MRWSHIADASVSCSGAEQEEEEEKDRKEKEEKKEESYNDDSPCLGKVVVAVTICTFPLMALQYFTIYTILFNRSI